MPPLIVLIDTDASFVYLIGRYAEQSGYALSHAASVQSARTMLDQLRPALVLFNLVLAAADDRAGLAAFQAALARHDVPIVGFSSAVVDAGDLAFEVDFYLTQPLLYADFCAACAALGVGQHATDPRAIDEL